VLKLLKTNDFENANLRLKNSHSDIYGEGRIFMDENSGKLSHGWRILPPRSEINITREASKRHVL